MKKCPKCGKTYDNSWEVCLSCSEKLVASEEISPEKTKELKTNVAKKKYPKLLVVIIILIALSLPGAANALISGTAIFFNYVLSGIVADVYNLVGICITFVILFGLIFRKNFARILLMVFAFLSIIQTLFQVISGKENVLKIVLASMKPEQAKAIVEQGQESVMLTTSYIFIAISLIISGLIIFYLTRPNLKEQFK